MRREADRRRCSIHVPERGRAAATSCALAMLVSLGAAAEPEAPLSPSPAATSLLSATASAASAAHLADHAAASGRRTGHVPADAFLESRGARIGEILVRVEDVFDTELPEESHRLYQLANDLHIDTRHDVIRYQLLFRSGDLYSARLLRETERLLRTRSYLYDCEIRPVRYRDNHVDIEVWVKDVWTLKPALSFGRSGGANDWRVELEDLNLMGTGKRVSFEWEDNVDRTSLSTQYVDSAVLGSRVELDALYADTSDGEQMILSVGRPFYSLDTRWAAGLRVLGDDRVDTFYSLGEPVGEVFHRQQEIELFAGRSAGLRDSRARRWLAGVTYQRDRYSDVAGGEPTTMAPDDLELVYPWVGYESVGDDFATTRNHDQLGRTEDLLLGARHRLRLGLATEALGSDRDRLVFRASTERGIAPRDNAVLLGTAAAMGRWGGGDGFENLLALTEARFYQRFGRQLFFANLQLAVAEELDARKPPIVHRVGGNREPPIQLLLGGDSGLRGYPLRYQDGDARALLTLEQRYFTDWHPLRLAFVGAAVFFDAGRTWPGDDSGPNLGWLADVGVGLRLSSSRSGYGTVVHIDVAFPLNGDDSIDSVQLLVTSKKSL